MRALLFLALALAADLAQAQGAALPGVVTTVATGARISGANGIHFGPDGSLRDVGSRLRAARADPETGAVRKRWTPAEGVVGPTTSLAPTARLLDLDQTGEVAGFRPDGTRVVAGKVTPA
jgi:hypothetical protein